MNAIFNRVSIRDYQDMPVSPQKIELILRAAMSAPSAGNQQPWEYYVVLNAHIIKELSVVTPYASFAVNAPLLFVPCYRTNITPKSSILLAMSASVENMLIEAVEQELGAVWIGIAPNSERIETVRRIIDAPSHLAPFALIACGYPKERKKQEDRYDTSRIHYKI